MLKKILITGGNKGIGLEVTRLFLQNNYKVIVVAKAMYWLATDCPEYINGTCIDINNGAFPR